MKKTLVLIAFALSGTAAHASLHKGSVAVNFNPAGAIIFLEGGAASSLYEGMVQVKSIPLEGGTTQGFLKIGEHYACTRVVDSGQLATSCVIHVKQVDTGVIATAHE